MGGPPSTQRQNENLCLFVRQDAAKKSPLKVATHAVEIPYAFDNLKAYKYSWDPMDIRLAHIMSTYYANFAKTGDPNGPGLPPWPVYHSADPQRMVFDENGADIGIPSA